MKRKEELKDEVNVLRGILKKREGLSDEGLDRYLEKEKAHFLGRYKVNFFYKCDYTFKESKCCRKYQRSSMVVGMNPLDSLKLAAGVYSSQHTPDYYSAPNAGGFCPHCKQRSGQLWKLTCYEHTALIGPKVKQEPREITIIPEE